MVFFSLPGFLTHFVLNFALDNAQLCQTWFAVSLLTAFQGPGGLTSLSTSLSCSGITLSAIAPSVFVCAWQIAQTSDF